MHRDEASAAPPHVVLAARHLTRNFGQRTALRDVSLQLATGEVLVLVGPNGAGKTTFVRIVSGTLRPTAGSVSVLGRDVHRDRSSRERVALVPQDSGPDPLLTPAEHVQYYLLARGSRMRDAVVRSSAMLRSVGLAAESNVPAHRLSGGMQRRILLAMCLATDAPLLLLDEPTAGLDPAARRDLWRVLTEMKTRAAILLTTHDMHEAETLADRVAIICDGEIRHIASVADLRLMLRHQEKFVIDLPPDDPALAELDDLGDRRPLAGRTLMYASDGAPAAIAARLVAMHVPFTLRPTDLEDVYLELVDRPA